MEDDGEFECMAVCTSHSQDVKAVAWHPAQELLVSFSYDDTAKVDIILVFILNNNSLWTQVWACEGGSDDWICKQTLQHTDTVWDGAFSDNGECASLKII